MSTTTIGELATLAGVTVRTLHHYDEIGLLSPRTRLPNGYRVYAASDVDELQQILTYRELDLSLEEIADILRKAVVPEKTLMDARKRVAKRIEKLFRIADSLDRAIDSHTKGLKMTDHQKLEAFGEFSPETYESEVARRWGDTSVFAESQQRTSRYSPEDWTRVHTELDDIYARFAALMSDGASSDSGPAAALVDEHRAHITKWYYSCSPEIHAGLGLMYVEDERFRSNIDKAGEGIAEFMSEAIAARYVS